MWLSNQMLITFKFCKICKIKTVVIKKTKSILLLTCTQLKMQIKLAQKSNKIKQDFRDVDADGLKPQTRNISIIKSLFIIASHHFSVLYHQEI